MKRYIALLRGVNVGGKNKLSMAELKEGLAELGFAQIVTYLNSGNAIFSSAVDDKSVLINRIKSMIKDRFDLDIPVFVISQQELKELLDSAPGWWGDDNKEIYDNLIFILPPTTYEEFYDEIGEPKSEYERACNYKNVVFWSFIRADYQKTSWWSKTASSNVSGSITIRTANTARKIAGM